MSGHGLFQRRAGAWQVAKRAIARLDAHWTPTCVRWDGYKDLATARRGPGGASANGSRSGCELLRVVDAALGALQGIAEHRGEVVVALGIRLAAWRGV